MLTGTAQSHRNRPAEVAAMVFSGMDAQQFYEFSHPQSQIRVQTRMGDVLQRRNPNDTFMERPELSVNLKSALKEFGSVLLT